MDELAIQIVLAGRTYPMRVQKSDEGFVRTAAKDLNARLQQYKEKFNLEDNQDLLAMVAFDSWVAMLKAQDANAKKEQEFAQMVQQLLEKLPEV